MLFTEFRFLPFFAIAWCVHWCLRKDHHRKSWLLLASWAFYAAWDWRFLSLIWISTLVDWWTGHKIHSHEDRRTRKRYLLLSLGTNLGLLGFFKYFNFFLESGGAFLGYLGLPVSTATLGIILPVGISFFTFQTMSYSLDIYHRKIRPSHSFLDLALFVGFFPQLVAGPIVRAAEFLPQLKTSKRLRDVAFAPAITLFLVGFIKKACISDQIAPTVDQFFANPSTFNLWSNWLGTLAYTAQIYCDFSGYSDMAIACAALLGYRLVLNFNFPYLATNIQEFWRRWHMSLSSWLRDYLYIPLGGSRGSRSSTQKNLLLTMLLGGLWHGAAWTFVIWGGLHGAALLIHRWWTQRFQINQPHSWLYKVACQLLTLWFVALCWIFFRAESLTDALAICQAFVFLGPIGDSSLDSSLGWVLAALWLAHAANSRWSLVQKWQQMPSPLFALLSGAGFALALTFTQTEHRPFIYFQF